MPPRWWSAPPSRLREAVWTGGAEHAVNIAGGLHHAMPGAASGFCVYNDPAVAIAWLLEQGAERVAYVDVDVHHGDGVERAFWDEPRVLTVSVHESGRYLFPGTGFPDDAGGPGADGSAVNLALPPGTTDNAWLRAFHAVVPPLLEEFRPQVLVTQHGCDSHVLDPLAHLGLTVDGQRRSVPGAARAGPPARRRAVGRLRRRRLRARAGRAAGLDPPAGRGRRRAAGPGDGGARGLAGVRRREVRPRRARSG